MNLNLTNSSLSEDICCTSQVHCWYQFAALHNVPVDTGVVREVIGAQIRNFTVYGESD